MDSHIENRQIRVFISSTFQDMQRERDYLMNTIFPQLRRKAAERDVSLVELDLRWGITEKEAQEGKVVQICLNEIDNSHPFFIGLLGDRYGWCPPVKLLKQDTTLSERYPWIKKDLDSGKSVTEIEMQYGVLRRKENDINACFFIKRDGENIEKKQKAFKNVIRSNNRYPYDEYTTAEELGEKIYKVFTELLDKLFPQKDLSGLELERLSQRSFLHSRCNVYVKNEANFKVLDDFLNNDTQSLVIAGESGMGKSSLIANWLNEHRAEGKYETIYHFVGNSGAEGDYNRIITRLIDEIYDLYDIPVADKLQTEHSIRKPKEILQELIKQVAETKLLLIVLDGINQLSDDEEEHPKYLNWMPSLPKGCKLLYSTIESDETMETFRRREYPVFHLKPLDYAQRRDMIVTYLSRFGKSLTTEQVNRIAMNPKSSNTLVLKTMLDELICFGIHEKLDFRISYYLEAEGIRDFFQRVLRRAEEDYGLNIVRDTMALVAVSHNGMSEKELLEITGIKQLHWSAFYCVFYNHFTVRNGLIDFSHIFFREAVAERYLDNHSEANYRQRIIDYFTVRGEFSNMKDRVDNPRVWSELAHQYYHTQNNKELYELIIRTDVFEYIFDNAQDRLASIWKKLRRDSFGKYSLDDYLSKSFSKFKIYLYYKLAGFSERYFKDYKIEEKALSHILNLYQNIQPSEVKDVEAYNVGLSRILYHLGGLHFYRQDYRVALREYQEAFEIQSHLVAEDPEKHESYLAATLNGLGNLYHALQNYTLADEAFKSSLAIKKRLALRNSEYESSVAETLQNMGNTYLALHDYEAAEKHFSEAVEIYRCLTVKNPEFYEPQIATTLNNIGIVLNNLHRHILAETTYREALEIRRRLATENPEAYEPDLAVTLNNIGVLHTDTGKYDLAHEEYAEALEIRRRLASKYPEAYDSDLALSLMNLGNLYGYMSRHDIEEKLHLEALDIRRRLALKYPEKYETGVANVLNNLGETYINLKDYNKAEKAYEDALEIYRRASIKNPDAFEPYLAMTLFNVGKLYENQKEFDIAETRYKEALEIYRRLVSVHSDVFSSYLVKLLYKIGVLHYNSKDYATAEVEFRTALKIARQNVAKDPETCDIQIASLLEMLTDLHISVKDFNTVERELLELLEHYSHMADKEPGRYTLYLASTFRKLGILHHKILHRPTMANKEYSGALENYYLLAKATPGEYEDLIAKLLYDMGQLLVEIKDYEAAYEKYEEAQELFRSSGIQKPETFDYDMAQMLIKFGDTNYNRSNYDEALKGYCGALGKYISFAKEHPENITYIKVIAELYNTTGNIFYTLGNYEKALKDYSDSLKAYQHLSEKYPGKTDSQKASILYNIGLSYKALKDYGSMEKSLKEALELYRGLALTYSNKYQKYVSDILNRLGNLHFAYGDSAMALKEFTEALDIYHRMNMESKGVNEKQVAMVLFNLGNVYKKVEDFQSARNSWEQALEHYRHLAAKDPVRYNFDVAELYRKLGELYHGQDNFKRAITDYKESLEIYSKISNTNPGQNDYTIANIHYNLGNAYSLMKEYEMSAKEYVEALELYRRLAKSNNRYDLDVADSLNILGRIHHYHLNDYSVAEKEYKESLQICMLLNNKNQGRHYPTIAAIHNNMGNMYYNLKNKELARNSWNSSLEIYRRLEERNPGRYESKIRSLLSNLSLLSKK